MLRALVVVCVVLSSFCVHSPANASDRVLEQSTDGDVLSAFVSSLEGTWISADPIDSTTDEEGVTNQVHLMMLYAPIEIEGLGDALFLEVVRSDTPWNPIEFGVVSFYPFESGIRMRRWSFLDDAQALGVMSGMGAAPSVFPKMDTSRLVPRFDLDIEQLGDRFEAVSPYPYAADRGDAVQIRTKISIDSGSMLLEHNGADLNGNAADMGSTGSVRFVTSDPYAIPNELEGGMVIIDYPASLGGRVVQEGDQMAVHYTGYLIDGSIFDSSYTRDAPFAFVYPPGNRAIRGWGMGMEGFALGAHRKLIIPGDLGYGEQGNFRASIPGNATLVFNAMLAELISPEPAAPQGSGFPRTELDTQTDD